jgi:YidC/Oxa1 family membrane protein insertase
MDKRTILAIGLSILVFITFQYFQQQYQTKTIPKQKVAQKIDEEPEKTAQKNNEKTATEAEATVAVAGDTQATAQTIVVKSDIYKAVINNRGAVLTSWELIQYKSSQNQVFEMIARNRDGKKGYFPGSIQFKDPSLTALANDELYQVSSDGGLLENGTTLVPPVSVTLTLKRGDIIIEKRYRFDKENYLTDFSVKCEKSGKALEGQMLLGEDIGPEQEHLLGSTKLQAVYFLDGKARREDPPKEESEIKKIEGNVHWVGLDMQYFSMIAIPGQSISSFNIQKRPVKTLGLDGKEVDRDLLRVMIPINGALESRLYLGPKKQSNLEAVKSADITGIIDYGMFKIIVYPLLASLRWIYQFVHNYGYAIILLTLILSLLLFPFRLKQIISMKKMQAVQPKVKAIQEKYKRYKKTDPKRGEMNQEIMALYKEHNVNPLGGCLPLILQFPLLFAFYSLLAYSIELRQAPFIGWLQDLSIKDPYYVLPVIMGITMFISQKMTPMTPGSDPMQAKMMMLMPVIFTFMFFSVSSGLNLYFLCSNIFQIAFQKIAERWISDGSSRESSKA